MGCSRWVKEEDSHVFFFLPRISIVWTQFVYFFIDTAKVFNYFNWLFKWIILPLTQSICVRKKYFDSTTAGELIYKLLIYSCLCILAWNGKSFMWWLLHISLYNNYIYKIMHLHHEIWNSVTILFSLMNMNCFQVVDLDLADFYNQKCL